MEDSNVDPESQSVAQNPTLDVVVFQRLPKLKHAKSSQEQDRHLRYKLLQCEYLYDFLAGGFNGVSPKKKRLLSSRKQSPEVQAFNAKTKVLGELVKFLHRMAPVRALRLNYLFSLVAFTNVL